MSNTAEIIIGNQSIAIKLPIFIAINKRSINSKEIGSLGTILAIRQRKTPPSGIQSESAKRDKYQQFGKTPKTLPIFIAELKLHVFIEEFLFTAIQQ